VTRDERLAALAGVPLFAGLDKKALRSVEGVLHERAFEAGLTMAEEGKPGLGFFIVDEGEAEVMVGGEAVARLGPGDYFGEIALLGQGPRTASVRALTTVRCFYVDGWHFRPLVKANPDLSWALLEALAKRLVDD
jgi:CRP-like cAMP-binding protein